jgi:hypothetical protein
MAWNPNPLISIRHHDAAASYKPAGRTVKLGPPVQWLRLLLVDETRGHESIGLDKQDNQFLESGPGTGTRY